MMQTPKRRGAHIPHPPCSAAASKTTRYAVETVQIRWTTATSFPCPPGTDERRDSRGAKRATASRRAVRQMRPARDEIIVCTALNLKASGVQYWGDAATGLFGERRQR